MNILFIFYVPSGGVETLNRQRSLALKKYNINAHFLYYENKKNNINEHHAPVFITNKDVEIKEIIKKGKYSAIIVVSDFKALPRLRKLGYEGKMIVEIQGYGSERVTRTAFTDAVPIVKEYADGLLNPKTPHINQLFDELFPSIPQYHFNNCFDSTQFCYQPELSNEDPIIGWVGRIEDNKNWSEFLRIATYLEKKLNHRLKIYMFEDPTISNQLERQKFQNMISQPRLNRNLTIFNNVPNSEMANYFSTIGNSGGFLCSTSKVEGAPYVLLEAMSCKCPVLTSDSGGVRSAIIQSHTGMYYKLGSPIDGFKQGLDLMKNITLRESIRENALQHLETHFSPDAYADNFRNMLRDIGLEC
ncbi:glycosyltransferase family 4 protein [Cytobacillus purgationiresistens]|uniref:Glycosyltransferase involved in cell wall biosynthesis n=1 Tax=Cytobacillus purgationiresistens TaxID=863449 RepID=A0ABU0AG64_9BACI|nr:glycosyltransferase family 4 protein [Cytobacillus purgationiresistens]MDQ0269721.1 glycosyltransferase involved in cell wall biosynthesis [Cytobacillus purgationiresistens]